MMGRLRSVVPAVAGTAIVVCASAAAQSVTERAPQQAPRPMPSGTVVLSEHEGTLIWRASDGAAFTLSNLAHFAAPILWFSPDEPLLRGGLNLPQPLPLQNPPAAASPAPSHVYFNVPLVTFRNDAQCAPLAHDDPQWPDLYLEWDDGPAAKNAPVDPAYPPLDCVELIKIRYFFYYSSEVGVGAHSNDFESLQVNIAIERNRRLGPATSAVYLCANGADVTAHCAFVTGTFGSAHGIAWYTNGLNVDKNRDTMLPITVLVEEGKHASSPDRNGDGVYSPGFDVDIHPNDAWGIRDSLRTRWLQGPAFRSDMAKRRRDANRVFPPNPNWRLAGNWVRYLAPDDPGFWERQPTYELDSMTEAADTTVAPPRAYCDAGSDLAAPDVSPDLGCDPANGLACERMAQLVRDEEGCRRTRMLVMRGWLKWKQIFGRINAGGSPDEYLTWPRFFKERVLPGVRLSDTRPSGWWMFPIAWNVGGFDGWVSARWNFLRAPLGDDPQDSPVDVLYSLSAARYFSSYIAFGADRLPLSDEAEPGRRSVAIEGGIKWRFEIPGVGIFSGVRIGVRADDLMHLRYPRMVFEFGGGSW